MDDITDGISELEMTSLDEFQIVRMSIATDTISFRSAAKPFST